MPLLIKSDGSFGVMPEDVYNTAFKWRNCIANDLAQDANELMAIMLSNGYAPRIATGKEFGGGKIVPGDFILNEIEPMSFTAEELVAAANDGEPDAVV
jgi:hypothetical protein